MNETGHSSAFCASLVGALADAGVTHAFISPGSRNTPMTLAIVAEDRITDLNIRDERSAGFMAVGLAKATGVPALVLCTSGSAATHYFPAVVEADQSATPFIVITSDRPERLRGTGAPQTLNQVNLYGNHVKKFIDTPGTGDGHAIGNDLVLAATSGIPGPVHVNLPFDEPLVPDSPVTSAPPGSASPHSTSDAGPLPSLDSYAKILFIASGRQAPSFGAELERVAGSLNAPVLADPQVAVNGSTLIRHADLIAGAGLSAALTPDVVVRLGPLPTSKPLWQWLERCSVPQIVVDNSRLTDPLDVDATHIVSDPADVLAATEVSQPTDASFLDRWHEADTAAAAALATSLPDLPFPSEPAIARHVAMSVRSDEVLWLASSRPIRDVDAFAPSGGQHQPLSNRGVNGIDGNISSAIGAALDSPTTLLIGDVAALHDATALGEAASLGVPLRIVVVNNNGGGIFSFLPQATSPAIDHDAYEKHWGTPHGLSLVPIASAFGVAATHVHSARELTDILSRAPEGVELIEIQTDREANVGHHETVRNAVRAALETL